MKKITTIFLLTLSVTIITSCNDGFDKLNTSKTGAISIDPVFVLNDAIILSSAPSGTLQYDLGIVQQIISSNTGVIAGANFNQVNPSNTPIIWQNYFQNVIKYTTDVITRTKDLPARSNVMNMARIIQANAFMIITDTYGDIPYTEAGQGYISQIYYPKYETQQSIYPKIIKELTDATAALSTSVAAESGDVLYGGSIPKWKKYGYSLLLRAGMRISKADAAAGKAAVVAAAAGGVILSNADNAYIRHDPNYVNGVGNTLNSTEGANYYLTKPFVDSLKTRNDPRLVSIAVRYVGATSGATQVTDTTLAGYNGTRAPAQQFGMPMGSDDATAQAAAVAANLGSRYAFTQVDRVRMASKLAPMFLATAAQCNLLLSEATTNGWITGTTALAYFNNGIAAHMDQLTTYGKFSAVSAANKNAYIASRLSAFNTNPVNQINYEYWIASFLNGPETWANFRRSGRPALAPNPYPGRTVPFITRLTYPPSEILVNSANVQAAIANMGGDKLDIKVWWNK